MKQIIIFAAVTFIVLGCQKSSVELNYRTGTRIGNNGSPAQKDITYMPLKGTWRLIGYWQDNGTGSGNWVTPGFKETISFDDGGKFAFAGTFPLSNYNYESYITENDGFVYFFPGVLNQKGMGDTYQYMLESPTTLVFFPICRENCIRRYELITELE